MFGSYLTSILLHVGLVLLVWLWPSSPPVKLDQPMMQISLTMGAPGGNRLPSAVLGPQGRPNPSVAASKPAPAAREASALPVPKKDIAQPAPEPKKESRPQPQPKPEAIPVAEKKQPKPKKEDKPEPAEDKPQEKPKGKTQDKAQDKPKDNAKPDKAKKPEPSGQDALKAALADAKKSAPRQQKSGTSSVAGALAELEKSARSSGQGGGGGGEGDGPGGGGIYDVYAGMVILAVRPNWSMPTYSREPLVALVRVRIDPQGEVLNCSVERSSGRAEFDASAVNAIIRTKTLPVPPTPEQQDLILTFNSLEMMGQ